MLQCLLATESLSTYFRSLHWKREINQDNPLGMGGKVAEAYAGLNDDVSRSDEKNGRSPRVPTFETLCRPRIPT